jgi:hypothetical protein
MFSSASSCASYGWKKDVFAVIKRKKEGCVFVWRIVVAAEKIKGRFVYLDGFHCAVYFFMMLC